MNRKPRREAVAARMLHRYQRLGDLIARWTRLEYDGPAQLPDGPALLVANHGFGTMFDMNTYVLGALLKNHRGPNAAPLTILTHDTAWTFGLGPWMELAGFKRANRTNAIEALAAGHLVVVLPGGDVDAAKPFSHRNEVHFGGRTGFAEIALQAGVPILPVVISGAGETVVVLSDGRRLASLLGLPKRLRVKTLPISLSLPWGLTVGLSGMVLPYIPLPAKMRASVIEPMTPRPAEDAEVFAARVLAAMNARMHQMTDGRLPFLGLAWPRRRPSR